MPLCNGLLVTPDSDPPPGEDRVNMKSLYDMFRHTNSHGLVSLPFLGILQYYFEKNDFFIKRALTELHQNLSYIALSGARDFEFTALSGLTAKISFLLKAATKSNMDDVEKSDIQNAYNTNKERLFVPKKEDPVDVVIDTLDEPVEHKKMMHHHVPPQVQTADEIEAETQQVDDESVRLKSDYDQNNDAATEHKKQDKITDLVDDIIDESNPFQNKATDNIWIEDDLFNENDSQESRYC